MSNRRHTFETRLLLVAAVAWIGITGCTPADDAALTGAATTAGQAAPAHEAAKADGDIPVQTTAPAEEPAPPVEAPAAQVDEATPADQVPPTEAPSAAADERFQVPAGDATVLLGFIEGLANPAVPPTSRQQQEQYLDSAARAISTAADRILAGETTVQQAVDAVQWKVEASNIQESLGDPGAAQRRNAFLDRVVQDTRPEVAGLVAPLRMAPKLTPPAWQGMDRAARVAAFDQFVADVKAAGPTANQARLIVELADLPMIRADSDLAVRAIDELLPEFAKNKDPRMRRIVALLEGIRRRLDLPGNKFGLSGTLMDGKPLDWESYRGKVVLVDFWASWCSECRRELPNIKANLKAYEGKGFEVLGICIDDDRSAAEQYIKQADVTWPNVYDDGGEGSMAEKYGIIGIPQAILVNKDGVVVTMLARGPYLGSHLRELLGDPAPDQTSATAPTDATPTATVATPAAR